jgi:hypothetical protein
MIFVLYSFRQRRKKPNRAQAWDGKPRVLLSALISSANQESFKGKIAGLPLLKNGQKNSAPVIARLV